jgi:hypothetical protein
VCSASSWKGDAEQHCEQFQEKCEAVFRTELRQDKQEASPAFDFQVALRSGTKVQEERP